MNPKASLLGLLKEWRDIGEVEGIGIQTGDWVKVAQCQERKSQLQEIISDLRQDPSQDLPAEVQKLVNDLIAQEQRNSEWLKQRRDKMMAEKSRVHSAVGNLRRVRSAYGGPRPNAIWNSYS